MKQTFSDYVIELSKNSSQSFSEEVWNAFQTAYDLHVGLASFFSPGYTGSDLEILNSLNNKARKLYKIQFHNIGKNPYQKYFTMHDHYPWLKLEHYLISHFYSIQKDESHISNRRIAINLGWLLETEKDSEIIDKACRKVTENLSILKNIRKTITVNQKHVFGKNGSFHIIKANWLVIIPLYQMYDPNKAFTIRARKGIKYRIISLLYNTVKSFTEGLRSLLKAQNKKYLAGLNTMDLDNFKESRFYLKYILDKILGVYPDWIIKPDVMIPKYHHPHFEVSIKDKDIYDFLKNHIYLHNELKQKYQINLSIVAQF